MTAIVRSRTRWVRAGVTIVLAMMFAASLSAADTPKKVKAPHPEALRCFDPRLADLIQQGLARSSTLQELTARLERAGVIVFLSYSHQLPTGIAGRTRFMAASVGWRYLSTELGDGLSRVDLLSLLGHELQHAVEIADAPDVVDEASLIALYRRTGAETGRGAVEGSVWFETQAAVDTGRRVYSELSGHW